MDSSKRTASKEAVHTSNIVSPGPGERTVRTSTGAIVPIPDGWVLLPPGDPALTRRAKAAGPTWTVQQKKGRKNFSLGVWANGAQVEAIRAELADERALPAYSKRRQADAARRDQKQTQYVEDFQQAVENFLAFAPVYRPFAERLAAAVAEHATPVGSGTVARTQRIPIEQRAESAVIAWLRHQTTAYDNMQVARVKGKRREVRRQLAEQSRRLLENYRRGSPLSGAACPLQQALAQPSQPLGSSS